MRLQKVDSNLLTIIRIVVLTFLCSGCTNDQSKKTVINSTGVTTVTLSEIGVILKQQRELIMEDTISEDESYYYSKVFEIGTSKGKIPKRLYIVSTVFNGPDKGEGAGLPMRQYLFGLGDFLYYCGNTDIIEGLDGASSIYRSIAEKMKKQMYPESNIIIKELQKIPVIQLTEKKRLFLVPSEVMVGKPDDRSMELIFDFKGMGPLYMTRVENSFLANNPLDFKSDKLNTWVNSCNDTDCYGTNRFFLFRADGTFLMYDVKPPEINEKLVHEGEESSTGFPEYTTKTLTTCEARSVADATPLSQKFIDQNPTEYYGYIPSTKDSFWVFTDSAPIIKEAYTIINDAQGYWDQNCGERQDNADFNIFVNNIPLLVWKDPFGRNILYKLKELNPPACCEPVFYLYSKEDTTITINLQFPQIVRNSRPLITDSGWTIRIDKNKMYHGEVKNNIPFVFWEGWVGVLPKPQSGFAVSSENLKEFMNEKLRIAGLDEHEITDFNRQWLVHCPEAPYYVVHFYDTEFAQKYCPVSIHPEPQTSIRVYIDIEPCAEKRSIEEQKIVPVKERKGLTYVEWGAVVR